VSSPEDLVRAARVSGVRDERVLQALRSVHREAFVPPEWTGQAFLDRPVPIAHGQVTTQPSLSAQMVEALELRGAERVLEIGTGLGFQTAILATLAAEVFSVERFPDLAEAARRNLADAGMDNVVVEVGDGTLGLPQHAPFDAAVVSAASPEVPPPLVEQLREGGRLVHPIGRGGDEMVASFRRKDGRLVREGDLTGAHFVRLIGELGVARED
jgi:protein-L-isoaspartate(D-aspartate) O-methyltransferase